MIIKTIYKSKIVYKAYTNSATSTDMEKRVVSIGKTEVKVHKNTTAYVMNKNGTTLSVLRGE